MSNIINVKIFVWIFVDLMSVADIFCAMEFEVKPLEIGTSGTIPCSHVEHDPKIRLVQWYKSLRIDTFVNGNPSLASWSERESRSLPNYHMENTTFSLIINTATLEDEGLYKCSVVSGDLAIDSNYYIRTAMYALPEMDPKIMLDPALNLVHCTVGHVEPLVFPVFNFDCSHDSTELNAVRNEDKTFTTSISCTLPQNKSASEVRCFFSYFNYQQVGSLDLNDITTDSLMENRTTTVSPMDTSVTCAGDGSRTVNHTSFPVLGILLSLSAVVNVILIMIIMLTRRKWNCGVHNCNRAKECKEKMLKPAMIMLA